MKTKLYSLAIPALLVVAGLTGFSGRLPAMVKQVQPQVQQMVKLQQPTTDAETLDDGVNGTESNEQETADANEANEANGLSEADESAALASQAKISVDQAKSAALAANPGTTVVKAELGDENGTITYSVELDNGADVKVDANTGAVLSTEAAGGEESEVGATESNEGDTDNVQEEHDGQPDDANETKGVENTTK